MNRHVPGRTGKYFQVVTVSASFTVFRFVFYLVLVTQDLGLDRFNGWTILFTAVEGSNCEVPTAPRRRSAVGPIGCSVPAALVD